MTTNLLVVDDEPSICWGLSRLGESMGYHVRAAGSVEEVLDDPEWESPHLLVLDVRLPGMDGLAALSRFQQRWPGVPVIIMTAHGNLETAVDAVRQGAFDYVVKPFDLEVMEQLFVRALANVKPPPHAAVPTISGGMIGKSPRMQAVFKQIALVAHAEANVLLCGESGTGKELAARAIHRYSRRAEQPFVAVNVAALNPQLAESELFGHVRGAFTGADHDRTGLFVQADQGTLFLDEIADIPLPLQVKLLRALEHGEVIPVGSNQPVRTRCRVISATHQNLLQLVDSGRFRHDLYFRLNAFQIELPPLREREEDVRILAEYFLATLAPNDPPMAGDLPRATLAPATLEQLRSRSWYGNVRELRNAMEHALIVGRGGMILPEHLPAAAAARAFTTAGASLTDRLHQDVRQWAEQALEKGLENEAIYEQLLQLIEPPLLEAAIQRHHGQCAAAARQLGMHRTTLRKKLDQYGIENDS